MNPSMPFDAEPALEQFCRLAGVELRWMHQRLDEGLLVAPGAPLVLDASLLRRIRRLAWLEREFDAVPELAALVADLEAEVQALRARLDRLGAMR